MTVSVFVVWGAGVLVGVLLAALLAGAAFLIVTYRVGKRMAKEQKVRSEKLKTEFQEKVQEIVQRAKERAVMQMSKRAPGVAVPVGNGKKLWTCPICGLDHLLGEHEAERCTSCGPGDVA